MQTHAVLTRGGLLCPECHLNWRGENYGEANIYLLKNGREELFMEKVDRIIPGEDQTLFLESVFGERRVVKAAIEIGGTSSHNY